jgi:AraC family transcriptional regulator
MKADTRSHYVDAVQRIVDHIVERLDEAIDLHDLAARAGLSPFHFHRVFKGMVGETPLELARRLRLERAAWRLAHTAQPVAEIAFDAGYDSHEAFTRAFRAVYATPPSGFRRRACKRIELSASCGVHFSPATGATPFVPRNSGGQAMQVEIRNMPEIRVAAVHHSGPYNQIPTAFERLGAIAGPAGLFARPEAAMIAIYHDDPESTPPDQLRSDAAVVVADGVPLPAGLAEARLPAGRYACTLYVGPYERLGDAWARFLGEWVPASGHRLAPGASYERYVNNPANTPKEALKTELCASIE